MTPVEKLGARHGRLGRFVLTAPVFPETLHLRHPHDRQRTPVFLGSFPGVQFQTCVLSGLIIYTVPAWGTAPRHRELKNEHATARNDSWEAV